MTAKKGDGDQNDDRDNDGQKKVTVIRMMRVMTTAKKGDGDQKDGSDDNGEKSRQ